jgi:hypothetical protein
MVCKVFQKLSLTYTINNYLFASLNYLLILKMFTETLLRSPFSVFGRCSLEPTSHWLQRKARINLSQAASGMILQTHGRLPVIIFRVTIGLLEGRK